MKVEKINLIRRDPEVKSASPQSFRERLLHMKNYHEERARKYREAFEIFEKEPQVERLFELLREIEFYY